MAKQRRSFTLVELLIVIASIALIVSLLLPSLKGVSRLRGEVKTEAILREFLGACDRFYLDHGFYPGLVPESVLAFHNHDVAHGNNKSLSGNEMAVLHLLGGYVLKDETNPEVYDSLTAADGWYEHQVVTVGEPFFFKVNRSRIGDGPIINGKQYPPYLSGLQGSIRVADKGDFGQWMHETEQEEFDDNLRLPEIVDAWGIPILYLRQAREIGPISGDGHAYMIDKPQFYIDVVWPYVRAKSQMWNDPCAGGHGAGSILSTAHPHFAGGFDPPQYQRGLAHILQHAAFARDEPLFGTPKGAVFAISAGADQIYFSAEDGPGSRKSPIGNTGCSEHTEYSYDDFLLAGPRVIELFDDIIAFSGATD